MKKYFLLSCALIASAIASGQLLKNNILNIPSGKQPAKNYISKSVNQNDQLKSNNQNNAQALGTIWSDDFSVPGNWTISNDVGNSDNWVIGTAGPACTYAIADILSTSAGNGFGLFDSDCLCSGDQIANLTTAAPISLLGKFAVRLEFQQYYRRYYDSTFVYVSINGTTWTKFPVNTTVTNNQYSGPNPTITTVDISSVAGNQATVWIRFTFYSPSSLSPNAGCAYSWMVDDVKIVDAPGFDLTLNEKYYYGYEDFTSTAYYTNIPLCQANNDSILFGGAFKNNGATSASNVTLDVSVTGAGVFNGSSTPKTLASGSNDSANVTSTFTPMATGTYNVTWTISQDSADSFIADNSKTDQFGVSDSVFSRDDDLVQTGFYGTQYIVGNIFQTITQDTATSISVFLPDYGGWGYPQFDLTGLSFSVDLYDFNVNPPTLMAQEFHSVAAGDIDSWLTKKLATPVALPPGFYLAAYQTYSNTDTFLIAAGDILPPPYAVYIDPDASGTWFYTLQYVPYVRLNVKGCAAQACAISVSASSTPNYCNSNSGTATATVTGGTPPFTYAWSGGGGSLSTATGLGTGSYNVSVTDAAGCPTSTSVTISSAAGTLAITGVTTTNDTCSGGEGSATVITSGGTPPLTYLWSSGAITQTASGLTGGTYSVVVSDVYSCTAASTGTVNDISTNLSIDTITSTDETSCGAGDGSATVTVLGGISPFTYLWSDSSTTAAITGLTAGSYQVTVTDSYGCSDAGVTSVNSAGAQTLAVTATTNVLCNGGSTGTATVTITGGSTPFTYVWNTAQSGTTTGTTITGTGISAGLFSVNVTGSDGCAAGAGGTITEPTAISVSDAVTDANCSNSSDGMIDITVSGGTPTYTYSWSNGSPAEDIGSLPAGTYTVVVTDANSCSMTNSSTVTAPTAITGSTTVTNVSCNGGNTGSINLTAVGGAGSYSYVWSNTSTLEDQTGLTAGTYTVVITDANSCTAPAQATVTEPSAIVIVNNGVDSIINITVTGGTPGYSYSWSNGLPPVQDPPITSSGTFTVTVTDSKGCTATLSVVGISDIPAVVTFELSPNPSNGVFTLKMTNPKKGVYSIEIRNILGQIMHSESVAFTGKFTKTYDLSKNHRGIYFLKVSNGKEQRTEKLIIY